MDCGKSDTAWKTWPRRRPLPATRRWCSISITSAAPRPASAAQRRAHQALAGFENAPSWTVSVITKTWTIARARRLLASAAPDHLTQMRSVKNETAIFDCPGDIALGDLACRRRAAAPAHCLVWRDGTGLSRRNRRATADAPLVVGTSLQVYPAAGLLHYAPAGCPVYVIDPHQPEVSGRRGVRDVVEPASIGVPLVLKELGDN
ncbi:MAG: hypothetical protein WKG07_48780 [Hymenobacter sp.]